MCHLQVQKPQGSYGLQFLRSEAQTPLKGGLRYKAQVVLKKDIVVRIKGVVSYREKPGGRGEKSIEIRIEGVSPLEPVTQKLSFSEEQDEGFVLIQIPQATRKQLLDLREQIETTPGRVRVVIQIGEDSSLPIEPIHRIDPSSSFIKKIKRSIPGTDVQVFIAEIVHMKS